MPTALVIGASRGLGSCLANQYLAKGWTVLATTRAAEPPASSGKKPHWIPSIDVATPSVGASLASACKPYGPIDITIITAGYFVLESFDEPNWDAEVKMYTTSAIAPVFLVHHLVKEGCLVEGAKIGLISSESGSTTLRHESEGGGAYGHHASKCASNMVGRLLSFDLKEKGIAVSILHPGFMRTEMTKSIGFDKYWDDGGGEYLEGSSAILNLYKRELILVRYQPSRPMLLQLHSFSSWTKFQWI